METGYNFETLEKLLKRFIEYGIVKYCYDSCRDVEFEVVIKAIMVKMYENSQGIEIFTLAEKIGVNLNEVGGVSYIT